MKIIKDFLLENKIYFETIFLVIPTIASVFIAIAAASISKAQTEIEKKTAQPIIDIGTEYTEDRKVSKVSIINSGGLLNEMKVDLYPFWRYSLLKGEAEEGPYTMDSAILPMDIPTINENIYQTFSLHTKTGVLMEIRDSDIVAEYQKITNLIQPEIIKKNDYYYKLQYVSMEYYLIVTYSDLLDKKNNEEVYCIVTGKDRMLGHIFFSNTVGVRRVQEGDPEIEIINKLRNQKYSSHRILMLEGDTALEKAKCFSKEVVDWYVRGGYSIQVNK